MVQQIMLSCSKGKKKKNTKFEKKKKSTPPVSLLLQIAKIWK